MLIANTTQYRYALLRRLPTFFILFFISYGCQCDCEKRDPNSFRSAQKRFLFCPNSPSLSIRT